jgi:uncharacterized protein YggE
MHHRPLLILLLGLAACGERSYAVPMASEAAKPGGALTVTGTATLEVSPDVADMSMTVFGEGARPGEAAAIARKKQAQLIDGLAKIGIETKDLKLSHLRLDPVYADRSTLWSSDRITGYRAQITVSATTTKLDQLDAIMEAGANAGAGSMSSQFRRSDLPELKKRVRDMAVSAAKDKAAQTAKALGIELGAVVSVSEGTGHAFERNVNMVSNEYARGETGTGLGGTAQSLSLEVTVAFELAKRA